MGALIPLFPTWPYQKPAPEPEPFWLTIAGKGSRCDEGGEWLERGDEIVYRHQPKTILCRHCAHKTKVKYRLSAKWRAQQRPSDYPSAA